MKEHQKLVRDKIPEIIEAKGEKAEWRTLSPGERSPAARAKIVEEGYELIKALTREEILGELVDIIDTAKKLMELHQISHEELEVARLRKREERGGFDEWIFLISTS